MSYVWKDDYGNGNRSRIGKIIPNEDEFVSFEKLLGRDVGILRITGFLSMNSVFNDKNVKPTKWEAIMLAIGMLNVLMVISPQFNAIIARWGSDRNFAFSALTAVLSGGLCFVKGWRLWFWRERLRELLRRLAVMWDDSRSRVRIWDKNVKTAEDTRYIGKCYIIMVVSLCVSYSVRPYILLMHYYWFENLSNDSYDYSITVYPAVYPSFTRAETLRSYVICVSWEQFSIIFIALYWICTDVIFAQLTSHTAIQFRVLCHDLEYITCPDDDEDPKKERKFLHRLSLIVKRHRDLYTYCETIECMFNPIIFLTMLFTAGNMCFCAFRLQKELAEGNWDEVVKNLTHVITLIVQAFIYCGYADQLTQESSLMTRAAYECQWMERSNGFKVVLQMIMMRSKEGFNCTAYNFFYVNLAQMTVIANTAGSYFALLNSMT